MNTLLKIVFIVTVMLFSNIALAQTARNNPNVRERLTEAKLRVIQNSLQLSDEQLKDLSLVYRRYESEINALSYAKQRNLMRTSLDSLSTEEADKMITAQLDNVVKISAIKRKYYPEFRTVLTPQQVIELYKSEAQIRRRVMQEFRRRFESRQAQ